MALASLRAEVRAVPGAPDLVACALTDLEGDLTELSFLCSDAERRLAELASGLTDACPHPQTYELVRRAVASARRRYRALGVRLWALRREAHSAPGSPALVERLSVERAALADRLRVEHALLAGLISAPDWQSPSFLHSLTPAAGRQTGWTLAHWNDYKRDRHTDAEAYERRYVEQMVDGQSGLRALLTGCGMAAFTTILGWLLGERKLTGPVVAGRGIYHETKLLLERLLPGRVTFVDECHTTNLLQTIVRSRPSAVFLDSLCNTRWMPAPDLCAVIEQLRGTDTYLVLDNTFLSVTCQPFALAGESVRLIVFESLLKYAQLGLDRANAGVIVAPPSDADCLDRYREHLGTNVPDVAVHALPPPERHVLERRLARLQRNAWHLAECLDERAPAGVEIVYPGLRADRGRGGAERLGFRGGCLSIAWQDPAGRLGRERDLVRGAVAEAARRGVRLLAGASFGFDTTRIYLAAANAGPDTAFVRIAAGTEHRLELEALAEALAAALDSCG